MAIAAIAKIVMGSGAAAGAAGRGNNKTGAGTIAKGVIIGQALLSVTKKIWKTMKEVSGHLKSTMNIIGKSIKLFLKPIADTMGLIMKPFAMAMLKYGIKFYRSFIGSKFFQGLLKPEEERTPGEKASILATKQAAGTAAGGIAGAKVAGLPGAIIGAGIGFILASIKEAWQGFQNIWDIHTAWMDKGFEAIGINMDAVRATIAEFLLETLPGWADNLKTKADETEVKIRKWADTLKTKSEEVTGLMTTFFTVTGT